MLSPTGVVMERSVVRHPGAVAVVPVVVQDVVLIRQFRAPVGRNLLEIPAGKLDLPGEDLEAAARRELAEEVGLAGGRFELLTSFFTTPGFSDEAMWIFLATELHEVPTQPHGAEEEVAEVLRIPLSEVEQMLARDDFEDAKTIVGLRAAVARLGSQHGDQ